MEGRTQTCFVCCAEWLRSELVASQSLCFRHDNRNFFARGLTSLGGVKRYGGSRHRSCLSAPILSYLYKSPSFPSHRPPMMTSQHLLITRQRKSHPLSHYLASQSHAGHNLDIQRCDTCHSGRITREECRIPTEEGRSLETLGEPLCTIGAHAASQRIVPGDEKRDVS